MRVRTISYWVVLAIFIFAGTLSWNLYFKVYRQEDTVDISSFPTEMEGWISTELPITEQEMEILETRNVFVRSYKNSSGDEVALFVVYSQNNRKVSHPPEICYTGGGAAILRNEKDSVFSDHLKKEVAANRLTISKGKFNQIAFYWFKVGDSFTPNYWKQQGLIALKSFLGQPASSALIRISANVENNDTSKAISDIKEFGRLIFPHLYQHLP